MSAEHLRATDAFVLAAARLDSASQVALDDSLSARRLREAFVAARAAYKRVEPLVEHFTPATADMLNGPALDDMAEDDPNRTVIPPEGFQVVEEYLWPEPRLDSASRAELRLETAILLANARRARYGAAATPLVDDAVWDAARLQLARVTILGLAGFDSPVALRGLTESAEAVAGIRAMLAPYDPALRRADPAGADTLLRRLTRVEARLRTARGFESFGRAEFIAEEVRPLGAALLDAQRALGIPLPAGRRAWRADVATPFDAGAFDPLGFAPAPQTPPTPAQVALGERLFFDAGLSLGGGRSCASCHDPARGFADGRTTSLPRAAHDPSARRNAPTVVNAGLQAATFADLRTTFLEDQVADVIRNRDEMHGSLEDAAAHVGHTPAAVRAALAAYLRGLVALDARFDRAVRGDRAAMTAEERRGFDVFMGKGKCGTCHFAPLFNGTIPPTYQKAESEVLGVPSRAVTRRGVIDPDLGRYRVTRMPIHRHAFKTPTLRNVALTAPYMHNGVYRTLEQVVDFYNRGGGAGIGAELPNQTLPSEPLRLTASEKRGLVAFMRTLTDTTSLSPRR